MPAVLVCGLGRLGAPLAAVLAANKQQVIGYDIDPYVVAKVNAGVPPVQETHLEKVMELARPNLWATTNIEEAVAQTTMAFVVVPTPSDSTGRFSNRYVLEAVEQIGGALHGLDHPWYTIAIVSTVMPGSTRGPIAKALERTSGRAIGIEVGVCFNPSLIALGSVVRDLTHPDLVMIGSDDDVSARYVRGALAPIMQTEPTWLELSSIDAEIAKISINCALVLKAQYANTIAELCEAIPGADGCRVTQAVGLDSRIGPAYLQPGGNCGGPCVPTGTLVQADSGLVAVETLLPGHRVLGHDGRFHRVLEVMNRQYVGNLIEISPAGFRGEPLLVTPDHPVWATKRYEDDRAYWYETTIRGERKMRLNQPRRLDHPAEFIPAAMLQQGDYTHFPAPSPEPYEPEPLWFHPWPHPAMELEFTPALLRLFGWYLSEGHTSSKNIEFTLHRDEEEYAQDIEDLCHEVLGRKTRRKKHGANGMRICTTCAHLATWLAQTLGDGSHNKRVPPEWIGLPDDQLVELLRGNWYGDGSRSSDVFTWASTSRELWRFVRLALLRLGVPIMSDISPAHVGRDGTGHRESYYLRLGNPDHFDKMNLLLPALRVDKNIDSRPRKTVWFESDGMVGAIRSVRPIPYSGTVWNLEVEEANSYALSAGVVHNCLQRDGIAFLAFAEETGIDAPIVQAAHKTNQHQALRIAAKLVDEKRVAILGTAYKPFTAVTEASLGTEVARWLNEWEVAYMTYDPMAPCSAPTANECIEWADAILVATAWPEFSGLDYGGKRVIDTWSALPVEETTERIGVSQT